MQNGDKVEGEVVAFKNGMIVIAKDSGGKALYSLDAFSTADQTYLSEKFPTGNKRESARTTKTATPAPKPGPSVETAAPTTKKTAAQNQRPSTHPGLSKLRQGSMGPELKARPQGKSEWVSQRDFHGKLLVVQFWSTSVPQSIEEVKGLAYLHRKYQDRGFELMGVAMDSSRRRVNNVEEAIGVNWPMRMDEDRVTIQEWGVTALPTNVLIDQNGVILREHISARELQYLLAERLGPVK
ncbi:TlpA disulfide reductase family protein [Cerasicoccus maritimus]|uniref:TlpA disulfide reductase family protein n=1 Tax=Cerasicoccus maritimus TaxID=490089 RepID=UPI002852B9AA|nr:TlpA disulfide reductase family protein [Cerasicoccus maritimus]